MKKSVPERKSGVRFVSPEESFKEILRLQEEAKRLRAIVEKLPRTADGVLAVPGLPVFFEGKATTAASRAWFRLAKTDPDAPYPPGEIIEKTVSVRVSHYDDVRLLRFCYSTREAAEAAAKGKL